MIRATASKITETQKTTTSTKRRPTTIKPTTIMTTPSTKVKAQMDMITFTVFDAVPVKKVIKLENEIQVERLEENVKEATHKTKTSQIEQGTTHKTKTSQ